MPGRPRLTGGWAALLTGGLALGSVACGVARPTWEAHPLAPLRGPAVVQAQFAAIGQLESAERFEAALLARVNADRAAHGLRPLIFDPELVAPARERAAAQRPGEALTHAAPEAPGGPSFAFQQLLKEAGVRYAVAGENLARPRVAPAADASEAAAVAQRALMASETHRQNILDPAFDRLAVGMTRSADGQIVFAQLFRGA